MSIHLEIRRVAETRKILDRLSSDLSGQPMHDAVDSASRLVQTDARKFSPVVTGRLRGSIAQTVTRDGATVQGVIGSEVVYAPVVERRKRYLSRAFEENRSRIVQLIAAAVAGMVRR